MWALIGGWNLAGFDHGGSRALGFPSGTLRALTPLFSGVSFHFGNLLAWMSVFGGVRFQSGTLLASTFGSRPVRFHSAGSGDESPLGGPARRPGGLGGRSTGGVLCDRRPRERLATPGAPAREWPPVHEKRRPVACTDACVSSRTGLNLRVQARKFPLGGIGRPIPLGGSGRRPSGLGGRSTGGVLCDWRWARCPPRDWPHPAPLPGNGPLSMKSADPDRRRVSGREPCGFGP